MTIPELTTSAGGAARHGGRPPGRGSRLLTGSSLERIALPLTWLAVIVLFSVLRPNTFATSANVASILSSQAALMVLTLGVLGPLTVGDFDISAAPVAGLCAMMVVILTANFHMNFVLAIVITMAAALVVGLLNGVFAAVIGLDPLIVTLGTGSFISGLTAWISKNNTITGLDPTLVKIVVGTHWFGIAVEFYYGLALCAVVFYVMRYTPLGRRMLIVGQSREVAKLSGINVKAVRVGSLVSCAGMAGLAGILYAGTSGSAQPAGGAELLLPAYAAAFLGATTITPGRFNAFGAFIAVYFLATGITGLQLIGAQNYVQQIFYGLALLLAVVVSTLLRRTRSKTTALL